MRTARHPPVTGALLSWKWGPHTFPPASPAKSRRPVAHWRLRSRGGWQAGGSGDPRTPHSQPRPQPRLWGTPAGGAPASGETQEAGGWRGGTLQAWAGAPGLPHWLGEAPPQGVGPCGEQRAWRGREGFAHRSLEQSRGARSVGRVPGRVPWATEPGPLEGCSRLERCSTRTRPSGGTDSCPGILQEVSWSCSSRIGRFIKPFFGHHFIWYTVITFLQISQVGKPRLGEFWQSQHLNAGLHARSSWMAKSTRGGTFSLLPLACAHDQRSAWPALSAPPPMPTTWALPSLRWPGPLWARALRTWSGCSGTHEES